MTAGQYMRYKEQLGAVFAALGAPLTDRQLFDMALRAGRFQPKDERRAAA